MILNLLILGSSTIIKNSLTWQEFLFPVQSQHNPHFCGSCYAIQVAQMLSTRIRIKRKGRGPIIKLSSQDLLCDQNNIGCLGGDSYQSLIYASKYGLSSQGDNPYQAKSWTNKGICGKKFKKIGFAKNPYILNGQKMILDQLNNGPIVCGMASSPAIDNYVSGIINDTSGNIKFSHDVLVVGYGQQNGVKFWIGKNSFGQKWGQKGFFRIIRGINNLGIQNYCVAADVQFQQNFVPHNITVDWRLKMSPIRQQSPYDKKCNSSWGMSVISMLQDRNYINNNISIRLSVQQLLNCDVGKCNQGDPTKVILFGKSNGFVFERCAHYTAEQILSNKCQQIYNCKSCSRPLMNIFQQAKNITENCKSQNATKIKIKDYGYLKTIDEIKMQIKKYGPVVCGIQMTQQLQNYMGGIFQQILTKININHYVSIVGYGVEGTKEYWLVRNSYGDSWGQKGLFRILIGKNNLGIQTQCLWANIIPL